VIFTFYQDTLRSAPFLCVDGVVDEGLNLSHWPGNRTPSRLKADTSTEMALNLARDSDRTEWLRGVEVVTNNHFDTDGLLSAYSVLRPEEALLHSGPLIQAARTGDFGEFTTPEAFKFDAVVTAFEDAERSPIAPELRGLPEVDRYQLLYDRLLGMMPDLLYEAPRYKTLWEGPFASLMRSMMQVRDVARIREHESARLTVIETDKSLDQMARFNLARHHRVLTATRSGDGWIYEMAFQIFSWFETVTPPRGTRIDLTGIARELDRAESLVYSGRGRAASRSRAACPSPRSRAD
jgi:hypothetical protein